MLGKQLLVPFLLLAFGLLTSCGGGSDDRPPFPCSLLSQSELRAVLDQGVSSPTSDAVSCQWLGVEEVSAGSREEEYVGITVEKDAQRARQYLDLREEMRKDRQGLSKLDGVGEQSGAFWSSPGIIWVYTVKGSAFLEVQLAESSEHPPTVEAAAKLLKLVYDRVGS